MPQIEDIPSSNVSPAFVPSEEDEVSSSSSSYILVSKRNPDVDCPYSSEELEDFEAEELVVSRSISRWLAEVADTETNIVQTLQEEYQHLLPSCCPDQAAQTEDQGPAWKVIGERDDVGRLEGEVELFYDNGDYFWGWYSHGVRQGEGSLVSRAGDHYLGHYTAGKLDGLVTETIDFADFHNITREVFYKNGVRHGFYREFKHNKKFWSLGKFVNGKKSGAHWTKVDGNAFLVGELDQENKPDGESLYLYPDLATAIKGQYKHGKLTQGKLVKLRDSCSVSGILIPHTVSSEDDSVIVYDQSSRVCISKTPHLRDFYELRQVFVKESSIPFAGEGLWAKTDIKTIRPAQDEKKGWSDYRIGCSKELDLDILPHQVSLQTYSATLGHKACHSFSYNAHFEPLWQPRFGKIMAVVANRDIRAGEEILANYNYSLARAPDWYRAEWFRHLREELDWPERKIFSWVQKEERSSGMCLQVLAPAPSSERFVGCEECGHHVVTWDHEHSQQCEEGGWRHRACL